jgi:serine/threonine protein kinase
MSESSSNRGPNFLDQLHLSGGIYAETEKNRRVDRVKEGRKREASLLQATRDVITNAGYELFPVGETSWLGDGAFANVFLAKHKSGRIVALKIHIEVDPPLFENARLALAVNRFDGDLRPPYYGCIKEAGAQPILVVEFIEGMSIRQYVEQLEVSAHERFRRVIGLGAELCRGLGDLHDKVKWAHRDLHANNVFVTKTGNVRLLDLGSAGTLKERTATIGRVCNGQCIPFDVRRGKRADHKDDIFAAASSRYDFSLKNGSKTSIYGLAPPG